MCFYNNRFINSSSCNSCRMCSTGPIGPTGPKGELSENFASITTSQISQNLEPLELASLSANLIMGSNIDVINNSNYITLQPGIYYINYSSTISSSSQSTLQLAFIEDNTTIEDSIIQQTITNNADKEQVSKNFLLNVLDADFNLALQNQSSQEITLEHLTITIIKINN